MKVEIKIPEGLKTASEELETLIQTVKVAMHYDYRKADPKILDVFATILKSLESIYEEIETVIND